MRNCPSCHAANEDDSRFCEQCGAKLDEVPLADETRYYDMPPGDETRMYEFRNCPVCGAANEMEAEFCAVCGEKLKADAAPEREKPEAAEEAHAAEGNVCPACGYVNADDAFFCENCGTKLEPKEAQESTEENDKNQCPACGFVNDEDAVFCENCGARLVAAEEKNAEGAQSGGQLVPVPAPAPKKPLSKLQKIVAIEVVALVALVGLFFYVGNNKYSAESVAEKYFDAYVNQDWETVYSLLDLPNGNFLAKDQFEAVMEDSKLPEVTDYSVQAESMGQFSPDELTSARFEAEYSTKSGRTGTMDYTLVKSDEKTLFFFDTWRVNASAVADSFEISVPKGAEVTLDGIALGDEFLSDADYEGVDIYNVTAFSGKHTVSAAIPWCEVEEREIDSADDDFVSISEFTLTEEGEQAMQAKMQTALETFYTSAKSGAKFENVEGLFASDPSDSCEEEYEKLLDNLTESERTLNQIRFSDFEFDYEIDSGQVRGTLEFESNYNYTYHGSSSSRTSDDDQHAVMYAYFTYEDDTYKITDIDVPVMP